MESWHHLWHWWEQWAQTKSKPHNNIHLIYYHMKEGKMWLRHSSSILGVKSEVRGCEFEADFLINIKHNLIFQNIKIILNLALQLFTYVLDHSSTTVSVHTAEHSIAMVKALNCIDQAFLQRCWQEKKRCSPLKCATHRHITCNSEYEHKIITENNAMSLILSFKYRGLHCIGQMN